MAPGTARVLCDFGWPDDEPKLCAKMEGVRPLNCDSFAQMGPFTVIVTEDPKKKKPEPKKADPKNPGAPIDPTADLAVIEYWNGEQWGGKPKKAKPAKK